MSDVDRARRQLLVLGCGPEQRIALSVARELGYATIAFDNDPDAAGAALADRFEVVDLKCERDLVQAAERAAPDGVFVHAAELAIEAAQVATALGLPGLPVETAHDATLKERRIARLSNAGLHTPGHRVLDRAAPLEAWQAAAQAIGFPVVVKPTDQAGARGVESIATRGELADYYARRDRFHCRHFVCEERLSGLELSTESVRVAGQILHHAIALRHYDTTDRWRPAFIEDGHSMPYALPDALQTEVESVIARSFDALQIESGVLKGDLLIEDGGRVVVLEMAARTSGGRFADTVTPLATGVHILPPLIELAMGDRLSRNWFEPTRAVGVSQRFFLHGEPGRVERWPAMSRLVNDPCVHDWVIDEARFRSGSLPPIESHRDRLGYVICTGASRAEADARALRITRRFAEGLEIAPDDTLSRRGAAA